MKNEKWKMGNRLRLFVRFKALHEAEQARHPIIDYIKVVPYFDFLRSDPRYAELLARLKLPSS